MIFCSLFTYNADVEPYKSFFDIARWDDLVINFRMENYRLFQLSSQSVLNVVVQAGLSALKTPQCYSSNNKNVNCPVCQPSLNRIAEQLPYSHCAQSRLICRLITNCFFFFVIKKKLILFWFCRVTGEPLNENNVPMMLPNGQVFGQRVSYLNHARLHKHFSQMLIWILNFQALPQISKENGIIICPKTNELFVQPKVEKVFVM